METQEHGFSSKMKSVKKAVSKWLVILLMLLIIGAGVFIYVEYFFVLGTGVKSGQLNFVVHKGYIFKTYEGKLILPGFKSSGTGVMSLQSNEFEFSIANKAIADSLMVAGGRDVELQYKEYRRAIPWRGNSNYVVDGIIAIK